MIKPPEEFEIILVDVQRELCESWNNAFKVFPEVQVHHGYFQDVKEFDCMVSPANSYGLMDGGIDLSIRTFFGMKLQENVQMIIKDEFYGEQPVGTCFIAETEMIEHPFLAHAPTMRVPAVISNTYNVYNAMFAILRAVAKHNKTNDVRINKVLCPGLGTATGRVSPIDAARQMLFAYQNFKNPISEITWTNIARRDHAFPPKM